MDSLIRIAFLSVQVLQDAAFWMVFSFAAGGLLHEFVPQSFFQKYLSGTDIRSLSMAVLMGMFLPMCSCGVIPLALSLYWSGASLAATLAFMAATPIINPAAALLATGASPGVGLTFLIAGVATNAPELVSIHRLISPRAAVIYASGLVLTLLLSATAAPVAEMAGIYKRMGLNVKVLGNAKVPESMAAGHMDVVYVGIGRVMRGFIKGAPVRVAANNHLGGSEYFVVKPDINAAADLKGKKVMLGANPDKTNGNWINYAIEQKLPVDPKEVGIENFAMSDKDAYLAFKAGHLHRRLYESREVLATALRQAVSEANAKLDRLPRPERVTQGENTDWTKNSTRFVSPLDLP